MRAFTAEDLKKILDDHRLWRESCGEAGKRADLRGASLRGAYLCHVNLSGARGNRREVKSIHTIKYDVVWTDTVLAIGCEQHTIDEWLTFDEDRIADMASDARGFMRENRDLILRLIVGRVE